MSESVSPPTPEELQGRLEEKRANQPRSSLAGIGSTNGEPELVETERRCRCGEEFMGRGIRSPTGAIIGISRLCPACRERREEEVRAFAERDARGYFDTPEERRERLPGLLQDAGISPWEHGEASFKSFTAGPGQERAVSASREFVAGVLELGTYDAMRGLYFFGETGTGKTHLAVAVARALLLEPRFPTAGVLFDRSLRLINEIQDCYTTRQSSEAILERRFKVRVWILDDLGTEQPSEDVVRRLTDVLQERAMRPTIVTSNLPPHDLESRNRAFFRIASRLGPAYFRTVELRGADARFRSDP